MILSEKQLQALDLERQAWMLFLRIRNSLEHDRTASVMKRNRLRSVLTRSYLRYERRRDSLFNYSSGGFAPPPVQLSGVVGQGANLIFSLSASAQKKSPLSITSGLLAHGESKHD